VRLRRPEKVIEVVVYGPYQVLQALLVLKQTRYEVALAEVAHVKTAVFREIPVAPFTGLVLLKAPGRTLGAATVRLTLAVTEFSTASVAVTTKVKDPVVVGVPVIVPSVARFRPAGIPVADHVYGLVPPVA
jgi:hypothetical protein